MIEFYNNDYVSIYTKSNTNLAIDRAKSIVEFINLKNLEVSSVLDLGCGSGEFLAEINKLSNIKTCIGLDISKSMLSFAKKRYETKSIKYEIGDITNFKLDKTFDLITCNYDVINHLQNFAEWKQTFKNSYLHLNPNGIFIFDFNTLYKCRVSKDLTYFRSFDGFDLVTKILSDKNTLTFNEISYSKIENNLFNKNQSTLTEYCYSHKEIKKALNEVGFKKIIFCDGNFKKTNPNHTKRCFCLCFK